LGGESVAGGKMKEAGFIHWESPNTAATNESGFTAMASGYRDDYEGSFHDIGYDAFFWSSTAFGDSEVWRRYLDYGQSDCYRGSNGKRCGFSLRCISD
jgi:uncharacterized protein (TIGR02145 family)